MPGTQQCDGMWQCPAMVPHCCVPGRASCDMSPRGAVPCPQRQWAALTLLPCSLPGSGFTLAWAAKDQGELQRFLTQNLSLPNSTAELLLSSSVDLREVGDDLQEVGGDPQEVGDDLWEVGDCTALQGWALQGPHCPSEWAHPDPG